MKAKSADTEDMRRNACAMTRYRYPTYLTLEQQARKDAKERIGEIPDSVGFPIGPYQGWPSYESWNVALYVSNERPLYEAAVSMPFHAFVRFCDNVNFKVTSEGVEVTTLLLKIAWDAEQEEVALQKELEAK